MLGKAEPSTVNCRFDNARAGANHSCVKTAMLELYMQERYASKSTLPDKHMLCMLRMIVCTATFGTCPVAGLHNDAICQKSLIEVLSMSDGYVLQCGRVTVAIDYWTAPQAAAFFLTHMHADHYHGLHNDWCQGIIYCSELTRLLLLRKWPRLKAKVIPLDEPVTLQLSGHETLSVTAIDANHCPVRKVA